MKRASKAGLSSDIPLDVNHGETGAPAIACSLAGLETCTPAMQWRGLEHFIVRFEKADEGYGKGRGKIFENRVIGPCES